MFKYWFSNHKPSKFVTSRSTSTSTSTSGLPYEIWGRILYFTDRDTLNLLYTMIEIHSLITGHLFIYHEPSTDEISKIIGYKTLNIPRQDATAYAESYQKDLDRGETNFTKIDIMEQEPNDLLKCFLKVYSIITIHVPLLRTEDYKALLNRLHTLEPSSLFRISISLPKNEWYNTERKESEDINDEFFLGYDLPSRKRIEIPGSKEPTNLSGMVYSPATQDIYLFRFDDLEEGKWRWNALKLQNLYITFEPSSQLKEFNLNTLFPNSKRLWSLTLSDNSSFPSEKPLTHFNLKKLLKFYSYLEILKINSNLLDFNSNYTENDNEVLESFITDLNISNNDTLQNIKGIKFPKIEKCVLNDLSSFGCLNFLKESKTLRSIEIDCCNSLTFFSDLYLPNLKTLRVKIFLDNYSTFSFQKLNFPILEKLTLAIYTNQSPNFKDLNFPKEFYLHYYLNLKTNTGHQRDCYFGNTRELEKRVTVETKNSELKNFYESLNIIH